MGAGMSPDHGRPNVNGMGNVMQVQGSELMRQRNIKIARFALEALDDEAFQTVLSDELRNRPWAVAQRAIQSVLK